MDRADKQGTWDDVNNEEHKMNKTKMKKKEASLKCLHIKTCSVGCKHKEL